MSEEKIVKVREQQIEGPRVWPMLWRAVMRTKGFYTAKDLESSWSLSRTRSSE